MTITPSKDQESNEQEGFIKKLHGQIAFWFLTPIIAGSIIIAFSGELNTQFVVGTTFCFIMALFGFWLIYKAKKQKTSRENPKTYKYKNQDYPSE